MRPYLEEGIKGGAIIGILTLAEFYAHDFLEQHAGTRTWMLFVVAFVIGFAIFALLARWFDSIESRKKQTALKQRLSLDKIGVVDGAYMYVVSDFGGGLLHASVLELKSSVADGFTIVGGQSFDFQQNANGEIELTEKGWFKGEGHKASDSVTYSYKGGLLSEHSVESGIGHYDFRHDNRGEIYLDGWFMVREKRIIRHVEGRKLKSSEMVREREDVLRRYLESRKTQLFKANAPTT